MPDKVTLMNIPGGAAGTRATLKLMAGIVRQYKQAYQSRHLALSIISPCSGKDWVCQVKHLRDWVRSNIKYRKDINGIETLQTPHQTLSIGVGDCDDQSILLATLLEVTGHPARFVALAFNNGEFSHVLTETKIGPHWVSAETTENVDLGWMPPGVTNKMVVNI